MANIFSRLRRLLGLRLRGVPSEVIARAGSNFRCGPGAFFRPGERVDIGENVFIGRNVHIAAPLQVHDGVLIASYVAFVGGDHRIDEAGVLVSEADRGTPRTTVVGKDVWIGHGSIILAGVQVGAGAIVAAGSVVTSDVAPCSIVGSPPARFIRQRFASESDTVAHLARLDAFGRDEEG